MDGSDCDGRLGRLRLGRPCVTRAADGSWSKHRDDPEPDRFRAARERVERAARLLDQGDSAREASAELRQALRDLGEDPPEDE